MTEREKIIETVNKLFVYTDTQNWDALKSEVFEENVHLDMSSMGSPAIDTTAERICEMWDEAFKGIDHVFHLAGNHVFEQLNESSAQLIVYSIASHYKANTTNGPTRQFVGTYNLKLTRKGTHWRIYFFKYNLKFMKGNINLD